MCSTIWTAAAANPKHFLTNPCSPRKNRCLPKQISVTYTTAISARLSSSDLSSGGVHCMTLSQDSSSHLGGFRAEKWKELLQGHPSTIVSVVQTSNEACLRAVSLHARISLKTSGGCLLHSRAGFANARQHIPSPGPSLYTVTKT